MNQDSLPPLELPAVARKKVSLAFDGGRLSSDAGVLLSHEIERGLGHQPRTTLYALYQGWIDTLLALHAARLTGIFATPASLAHATARRDALQECARLEADIARLRAAAAKEKQLPRQVELNLELKRLQAAQAAARAKL